MRTIRAVVALVALLSAGTPTVGDDAPGRPTGAESTSKREGFWIDPVGGNQYFVGVSSPESKSAVAQGESFWLDRSTGNQYFVGVLHRALKREKP